MMPQSQQEPTRSLRDTGPYSSRNTTKGALLAETAAVVGALSSGLSIDEVRVRVLDGLLIPQRTRVSRERVWQTLHYRALGHGVAWVLEALEAAYRIGPHSPEFVSLLYLLYALRDRLSFDVVTSLIWQRWLDRSLRVTRADVMVFLDELAQAEPQIPRWSLSSREKLSGSILTAARDFGLLQGKQTKSIVRPLLPLDTAEHLLRILTSEGVRGADVLREPTWRLFLYAQSDVVDVLMRLAQERRIHFERAGSNVALETSDDWKEAR